MNGYNFTEQVRRSLALSREEAARLRHEYVGTEHILLGIVGNLEGVTAEMFDRLGVDRDAIQDAVEQRIRTGKPGATGPDLPYTSRAKKSLELAMVEARDVGHSYVGNEHLLIGLAREGGGIAAVVLHEFGVTPDTARGAMLAVLGEGPRDAQQTVPSSRGSVFGYSFTERVRKVLALAREEAASLNHGYVGAEHILLAILAEGEGVGITTLQNLGVKPTDLRARVLSVLEPGNASRAAESKDLAYTSRGKKVLELAMASAREINHSYVGTEHVLLGLLREEKGIAAQVLVDSGVTEATARAEILRILGTEMKRSGEPEANAHKVVFVRAQHPPPELIIPRFPERLRQVVASAYNVAAGHDSLAVTPAHAMIALLEHGEGMANAVLNSLSLDRDQALSALSALATSVPEAVQPEHEPKPDAQLLGVLQALHGATDPRRSTFGTQHLLLLTLEAAPDVAQVFENLNVPVSAIRERISQMSG